MWFYESFCLCLIQEPVEEEDEDQEGEGLRPEEGEAANHDQGKAAVGGNPKSQVQVIITEESTFQGQGVSRVASAAPRAGEVEGRTGAQEETEAQGRVETGSTLEYRGISTAVTTMDEIPVNRDGPSFDNRPATSGEDISLLIQALIILSKTSNVDSEITILSLSTSLI